MNRKDTIIIAVLVNVALLMVLFATAIRSDKGEKTSGNSGEIIKVNASDKEMEVEATMVKKFLQPNSLNMELSSQVVNNERKSSKINDIDKHNLLVSENNEEESSKFLPDFSSSLQQNQKKDVNNSVVKKMDNKSDYVDIVVKKGDFLEKIARANQTTVSAIMQLNQLTTTQLKIGQVLKVPVSEVTLFERNSGETKAISSDHYYTVKEGESPWVIALKHKMRLEDLLKLNDLDEYKARRLKPGDQLRIK